MVQNLALVKRSENENPFPKSHSWYFVLRPLSFCFVCFDCINLLYFLNLW